MKTQEDRRVRMVALENLIAMCEHISGMCHRYSVTKVSRSRVHVEYSNPNEYGAERPMTAILPALPSAWPDDAENPRVLMMVMRVVNDNWDGEGWQAFDSLLDCETLWRAPDGTWERDSVLRARIDAMHASETVKP